MLFLRVSYFFSFRVSWFFSFRVSYLGHFQSRIVRSWLPLLVSFVYDAADLTHSTFDCSTLSIFFPRSLPHSSNCLHSSFGFDKSRWQTCFWPSKLVPSPRQRRGRQCPPLWVERLWAWLQGRRRRIGGRPTACWQSEWLRQISMPESSTISFLWTKNYTLEHVFWHGLRVLRFRGNFIQ